MTASKYNEVCNYPIWLDFPFWLISAPQRTELSSEGSRCLHAHWRMVGPNIAVNDYHRFMKFDVIRMVTDGCTWGLCRMETETTIQQQRWSWSVEVTNMSNQHLFDISINIVCSRECGHSGCMFGLSCVTPNWVILSMMRATPVISFDVYMLYYMTISQTWRNDDFWPRNHFNC